ncbi:MAG: molybdopterin-guanine dinucleotide biosynthesis protein B [Betaproteobacteria bacterium]|nr:molybdopterin-guanine dinucleotide biosynthesis protein B [Betaproteobacteria bacterium]
MKVIGFAGFSGSGKTTLVEQIIVGLKQQGLRVSVIKHAHHQFDVDQPGKDSWRHRQAGAFEVLVASNRRLVLQREYEHWVEPKVHHLLAEVYDGVDWVLVEGFKSSDLPKIEVWRPESGAETLYLEDPFIKAIATSVPDQLRPTTLRPVLDLNQPQEVLRWMLDNAEDLVYEAPLA